VQQELGIVLDPEKMPRHVAIIMDGNGRWATNRGWPRALGHYQGYEALREIVRAASDLGIKVLTVYAFSTENWKRNEEVGMLMGLYEMATRAELPTLQENNVIYRVSGVVSQLPESLQDALATSIRETAGNTGMILNLAMNYGGRQEILLAVQEACRRVQDGSVEIDKVTEEYFSNLLYTANLPDPDLLIRTANELRVSNFLLWQIAYAEFWMTSTLWPDFAPANLIQAIADYQKRVRRFGKVLDK
jgi:undecaprenyl diphosphate synthase